MHEKSNVKPHIAIAISVLRIGVLAASAKGPRSHSQGPGMGSKASSTTVNCHVAKLEECVAPH